MSASCRTDCCASAWLPPRPRGVAGPPGALFGPFKEVISTEGVPPEDIAFYFAHWLTDLAGAVPTPLYGSEKFVLQFPHAVLGSFIRSFSVRCAIVGYVAVVVRVAPLVLPLLLGTMCYG